jgi:hypothetical protein
VGYLLTLERKKKMKVFDELYEFNQQLLLNLKYSRQTLSDISCKYKYVNDLINGKKVLDGQDGQFLSSYVSCLGGTDARSQIDYLNERGQQIATLRQSACQEYKKYSALYIKIAFMIGVLLAVLLA